MNAADTIRQVLLDWIECDPEEYGKALALIPPGSVILTPEDVWEILTAFRCALLGDLSLVPIAIQILDGDEA